MIVCPKCNKQLVIPQYQSMIVETTENGLIVVVKCALCFNELKYVLELPYTSPPLKIDELKQEVK